MAHAAAAVAVAAAVKTPALQRSFSEHVRDSTHRAWGSFWRGVRERRLCEIEVREACEWLRAAGFPQYVQLFRECSFPVDLEEAKQDHDFLDKDAVDSLCRRLNTLNKCAEMRLELRRLKHRAEDCGDEDFCAISPSWTCDRKTRRWRRLDNKADVVLQWSKGGAGSQEGSLCDDCQDVCSINSSSSTESDGPNGHRRRHQDTAGGTKEDDQDASRSSSRCSSTNRTLSLDTSFSGPPSPSGGSSNPSPDPEGSFPEKSPRRKGPGLLKKMEKLRGRTGLLSPAHNSNSRSRTWNLIRGPDLVQDQEREERLHLPTSVQSGASSSASSPPTLSSSSSNTQSESSSIVSTPSPVTRVRSNCKRSNSDSRPGAGTIRNSQNIVGTHEDYRNHINHNNNNSLYHSLIFQIPDGHKPGTFPTSLARKNTNPSIVIDDTTINWRTGSFHGYQWQRGSRQGASSAAIRPLRSPLATPDHRMSVYDNVPDEQLLSGSDGGSRGSDSDAERTSDESEVGRLLAGEDIFSALDSILERINDLQQLVSSWSDNLSEDDSQRCSSSSTAASSSLDSPPLCPSSPSHIHLEVQHPEEVARSSKKGMENGEEHEMRSQPITSSRGSQQQLWSSEKSLPSLPTCPGVESLSVSEFTLLQKLALLKLTALMDKHSPTSKQGWSWTAPKVSRKNKTTEAKARRVFGVPLLLSAQQTGEPLPPSIQRALLYLQAECLDQVGLFRKSGVKSRIQFLRERVEADPNGVSFDHQSAFDVADLVKQYFRDLPEPVFTSRLSDTFLHIYQYFPKDQQLAAAQAAVLLLPDENREALRTLLLFLRDVVACVDENQMTPTNIAVCLAPSLFHLNTLRKDADAHRSGHRKYSLGRPDQRDLSENLAATQGLASMISDVHRLFQLPQFWRLPECPSEERGGRPFLEEQEEAWRKLQRGTQLLLMEARERSRGWEEHPAPEDVELAFKKVDDGCPLRMWRGTVEVEAPHAELLHRLLREQTLWDRSLRQAAVVQTLSEDAEVYRCLRQDWGHGLGSRLLQEHLLLRTWQADPSSGPVYLSSMSTEHPDVLPEGVRAHVHCCLYLLEPSSGRKTRLTHLCRTDTRGRSLEWHGRLSGHLLASSLLSIRDSFQESDV